VASWLTRRLLFFSPPPIAPSDAEAIAANRGDHPVAESLQLHESPAIRAGLEERQQNHPITHTSAMSDVLAGAAPMRDKFATADTVMSSLVAVGVETDSLR